jgi:hypothetical protein
VYAKETEAQRSQQREQKRMINAMVVKAWIGLSIIFNLSGSSFEKARLEVAASDATPLAQENTIPAIYPTTVASGVRPIPCWLCDPVAI